MPPILPADRFAVTGATGFLGSHVVRALVERGCAPVLMSRSARAAEGLRAVPFDLRDPRSVTDAVRAVRPDVVLHLAGTIAGRAASAAAARECAEVNIDGTLRLLEAAQESGARRIVLLGSALEYGNQPGPLHEGLPLQPATAYGISKAAASLFAQALFRSSACPVVVLRLFTVYGPGQSPEMFVAEAIDRALDGEPFRMSQGTQRRDLVFVGDVVEAILAAAAAPGADGEIVNVGSGQALPLQDVARRIWRLSGTAAPLLIGALAAAPVQLHDTWADVTRARRVLGWQPRTDLDSGLRATIESQRERAARRERPSSTM